MALFLTLVYILSIYISVPSLFPWLIPYRIELLIAIPALLVTIPRMPAARVLGVPQSIAIVGLTFGVAASIATTGWLGGALTTVYSFVPVVLGFFLVAVNCRTKLHLQLVTLTLFAGSVFYIIQGTLAVYGNVGEGPYTLLQGDVIRARGLGVVNDPNDLSQVLVSLLPCMFLFWKKGRSFANAAIVWVPAMILVYGMYLARSRSGIVALVAVIGLALRRKIRTVPAFAIAGGVLLAALSLGWSGGRDISAETGSDRTDAWYAGLQMFKEHPLFGVGNNGFADHYYMTAHNSVVVCAAELGLVGFLCWILFVLSTLRDGVALGDGISLDLTSEAAAGSASDDVHGSIQLAGAFAVRNNPSGGSNVSTSAGLPSKVVVGIYGPGSLAAAEGRECEDYEIRRMARILVIAVAGFLVSGWFLSRNLAYWLFIYGGMMVAVTRMAEEKGIAPVRATWGFLSRWTILLAAALLGLVSFMVRFTNYLLG